MAAAPTRTGPTLAGKVSWFGGPHDPSAGANTASGAPTSRPGIAVYNRATLGGWWRVTFPNGRALVLQQTDIGPAPWTGRVVDVTYSALPLAGYSEHNFPTDSHVSATYLGKRKPADTASAPLASAASTASTAGGGGGDPGGLGGDLLKAALFIGLVAGGVFLATFGIHVFLGPRSPAHRAAQAAGEEGGGR